MRSAQQPMFPTCFAECRPIPATNSGTSSGPVCVIRGQSTARVSLHSLHSHLADGEFPVICPSCGIDLYVVIGEHGNFVAAEDWVNNSNSLRQAIEPNRDTLSDPGEWLRERAETAGQVSVAEQLSCLFGFSRCPGCGVEFRIAEAVADSR